MGYFRFNGLAIQFQSGLLFPQGTKEELLEPGNFEYGLQCLCFSSSY
ncbi:hypothetical protein S35_1429 [Escherichia coli B104]|nr:hypothetical protein S35_1429 [Escherichia coli B104]